MKFDSLDSAFKKLLFDVNSFGAEVNSRGSRQRELLFQSFEITDPCALQIYSTARKFSSDYATAEWLWYLSKNPAVNNIGKLAKIWLQIKDLQGEVESNYGVYLSAQWEWVIGEIMGDNDTRRATVVINQPHHKNRNKLDYPCTQYLQFLVRDKKLHLGVNMRSNDIIFGLCNDVFTFCLFQQLMLNELNARGLDVSLGSYYHYSGSLHLYERHYTMAEDILAEQEYASSPGPAYQAIQLREDFSWDVALDHGIVIPSEDTSRKELTRHVSDLKGRIYEKYS
jgi:thymidylate synthase|tara:strand:+ start:214 stop:1059 length:846 start_codon:yes stop_codon:yes gene_type:complete